MMPQSFSTYWRRMASGSDRSIGAWLLVALLAPLSLCYGLVQWCRALLYRQAILQIKRLPRPVISVGNITVGGTGKTPVTAWLAGCLMEQGQRVVVLSRGYGGSMEGKTAVVSDGSTIFLKPGECGDEPYLLVSTVPGLAVVIGSSRHAAGMLAMEQLSPDVFLLDDGFQHISLHRDMNILLLDAERPFGNGLVLPAGLLREPRSAALRADWIIHTRCCDVIVNIPGLDYIPQAAARHELRDLMPLKGGEPQKLKFLKGKTIIAFAGIAEPDRFFADIARHGAKLASAIALPDHARYDADTVDIISGALEKTGAAFAVTTEKDAVKLREIEGIDTSRIMAARLKLAVDGGDSIIGDILNLLQKE